MEKDYHTAQLFAKIVSAQDEQIKLLLNAVEALYWNNGDETIAKSKVSGMETHYTDMVAKPIRCQLCWSLYGEK